MYGLGLEALKLVRVELRKVLRLLYLCFGTGLVAS